MKGITHYEDIPLSDIVGLFYHTAGTHNGFTHVPSKSLIDRFLSPDAWHLAKFEKNGITSEIWEYNNILAVDSFLDSITIKHNSKQVYFANVNRYSVLIHINQSCDYDPEWVKKIMELSLEYQMPSH